MTNESPAARLPDTIQPNAGSDTPPQTLQQAMRAARVDDAERVGALADLRAGQIARLEMLQEALKPLLAQIPSDAVDLFDVGLMPAATPRLFVDMIGFIEMGRDSRTYRLLQDTRHARLTIAESASVATMVEAITQYVARRLLEREKALSADSPIEPSGNATPRLFRWLPAAFSFLIYLLGAITFFAILAAAGWYLWTRAHGGA